MDKDAKTSRIQYTSFLSFGQKNEYNIKRAHPGSFCLPIILHKQTALLLGPIVMDQVPQPFRRRGQVLGETIQTQIFCRLPPDQLSVERDLIALQWFIASFAVMVHMITPL
jgi:hypothetical protein